MGFQGQLKATLWTDSPEAVEAFRAKVKRLIPSAVFQPVRPADNGGFIFYANFYVEDSTLAGET
jgi:hypothetical protein